FLGDTENQVNLLVSSSLIPHLGDYEGGDTLVKEDLIISKDHLITSKDHLTIHKDTTREGKGTSPLQVIYDYLSPYRSMDLGSSDSVTIPPDLFKWLELCQEGRIYSALMTRKERDRS